MKDSIVEIKGHRYRYTYKDGKTVYIGPVGEAPSISEKEFLKVLKLSKPQEEVLVRAYSHKPPIGVKGNVARALERKGLVIIEEIPERERHPTQSKNLVRIRLTEKGGEMAHNIWSALPFEKRPPLDSSSPGKVR